MIYTIDNLSVAPNDTIKFCLEKITNTGSNFVGFK